jgi:hypothetical protein
MYDLPAYVWVLVLAGTIGIPAVTWVALFRGALAAGLGRGAAAGLGGATAVLLGGWLVASSLLAWTGAYDQRGLLPPLAIVAAGALVALLLLTQLPVVSRALAAPGTTVRLALPHTFRVAGLAFLVVMALGHLPAMFAVPAGLGDIATGLAAPFVARRLARGTGRAGAVWFNALGLADLVVAVSMATLATLLLGQASTAPLRLLPLALVPTTAVPLAVALHVVSLGRLLRGAPSGAGGQEDSSMAAREGVPVVEEGSA